MVKKKKKRTSKKSHLKDYSGIGDHQRKGKQLIPPYLTIPQVSLVSWRDDRLPEMLWAALLLTALPRSQALDIFREIGRFITHQSQPRRFSDITHTGLSKFQPQKMLELLIIIGAKPTHRKALQPLLLFETLPAREHWEKALAPFDDSLDWEPLMIAVANTLDHQSQKATDCRWLRIYSLMLAGELKLPSEELVKEIYYYPNYGDMRKVRPLIRAAEGSFSMVGKEQREWPNSFWKECFEKTACFPIKISPGAKDHNEAITTADQLVKAYNGLLKHFHQTITDTSINPCQDTIFGTAFYCLALLGELLRVDNSQLIIGRSILRTLTECYITLAYLVKKDDKDLWQSFRVFGTGQAKLAFLKLDALEKPPEHVSIDTLKRLASDDMWLEYVPINLGHWEKSNLRRMSEKANVKDDYDSFYSWTSTFAHGHWGAIRDTVFDTCGNPLHRFHRIPSTSIHVHPDVIPDACYLIDKILEIVSNCYPTFSERVTLTNDTSESKT